MTVQRSQSSSTDNATRELDSARDRPRDKVRDQPDKDTVDRFRNLMDKPKGKEEGLLAKKPGEDKLLQGKQDGKEPQADASEAAADSAKTSKRSGCRAITSSVLTPTEPVEPSTVTR